MRRDEALLEALRLREDLDDEALFDEGRRDALEGGEALTEDEDAMGHRAGLNLTALRDAKVTRV